MMSIAVPRQRFPLIVTMLALAFLGVFFLFPLSRIFGASFLDPKGEHFTLANYAKILGSAFYQQSVANSLEIGAIATLLTVVLALPLAFALARLPVAGKSALLTARRAAARPAELRRALMRSCSCSGERVSSTQALRDLGIPFGSIYGVPGIVAVYTLTLYPYVLLPTIAGLKAIDVSVEEASRNLGASRWRGFWTVTLPIVIPSVLSGALLVFIETLENFGVPIVLAEDKPILSVEAFKLFVGETDQNPSSAGVLGVLLIVSTALVLLHPAPLSRAPALRHRRQAQPAGHRDRLRASARGERVLLGRGHGVPDALLRRGRALVHEVPRARCCRKASASTISPPCSSAPPARSRTR